MRGGAGGPAAEVEKGEQFGEQAEPIEPVGVLHHVVNVGVVVVMQEEKEGDPHRWCLLKLETAGEVEKREQLRNRREPA